MFDVRLFQVISLFLHFFPFDPPTKAGVQLQELIVLSTHTIKLIEFNSL
jgi:hypothetical protein